MKPNLQGTIKPGDFTGVMGQEGYNPMVKSCNEAKKSVQATASIPYHVVMIMARYGVPGDADLANRLYTFLSKKNSTYLSLSAPNPSDRHSSYCCCDEIRRQWKVECDY